MVMIHEYVYQKQEKKIVFLFIKWIDLNFQLFHQFLSRPSVPRMLNISNQCQSPKVKIVYTVHTSHIHGGFGERTEQ